MRKLLVLGGLVALVVATAVPAGAAKGTTTYGLAGEARALEVAIGETGLTLGLALSQSDSTPKAVGVGAGRCALLGETADPSDLPCTDNTTVVSRYPGKPGSSILKCGGGLPDALEAVLDLDTACGSSTAKLVRRVPSTTNLGQVGKLNAALPVSSLLTALPAPSMLVEQLTGALAPVLDQLPVDVESALDQVVGLLEEVAENDLVAVEIGKSTSNIVPTGNKITVKSTAAGARIGVLGVPSISLDAPSVPTTIDPLEEGLLIIEVGTAVASATVDRSTALATGAADPALITVKVRDITKPDPTYVEVSVAPGQTLTVLEGTPAESTIIAADSSVTESKGSAQAAADAVRLHLLKGVNGGVKLGLARATAAAQVNKVAPKPPIKKPPVLPVTGGTDLTLPGLLMVGTAIAAYVLRRRLVG